MELKIVYLPIIHLIPHSQSVETCKFLSNLLAGVLKCSHALVIRRLEKWTLKDLQMKISMFLK